MRQMLPTAIYDHATRATTTDDLATITYDLMLQRCYAYSKTT